MENTPFGFVNRGNPRVIELREFFAKNPSPQEIKDTFYKCPEVNGIMIYFAFFADRLKGNNEVLLEMFEAIIPENQNDNFENMIQALTDDESKAKSFLLLDLRDQMNHLSLAIKNIKDDEVKVKMLLDSHIHEDYIKYGIGLIKKTENRHPESPIFTSLEKKDQHFDTIRDKVTTERSKTRPEPLDQIRTRRYIELAPK